MNNNILIGHLGWDGCHFLASCLTMSDEVYFNHHTLRGKIEYFFKNMANITKVDGKPVWSDVFMFYGSSYQSNGYVHYRQLLVNDFVHFALLKKFITFFIIYFIYLINLVQY